MKMEDMMRFFLKDCNGWAVIWIVLGFLWWSALGCLCWTLAGCTYDSGGSPEVQCGKVSFLDVGQGLGVLLEYQGHYGMFDMGPDSVGVMDSLAAHGVDTLDWAVISHSHRDHGGGFLELAGAGARGGSSPKVHVRRLYVGPDTAGGFVRDSILRMAQRFQIGVDTLYRGDGLILGSAPDGLRLKVLWPTEYSRWGENSASLVMMAELVGTPESRVLLTGDLDSAGERRLLELSPDLQAELLQVAHHGSSGSSSLRFLAQVSPRYGVISVGEGNSYGHPTESVLRKLQYVLGDSASISRTDRDGSVSFQWVPGVGIVP